MRRSSACQARTDNPGVAEAANLPALARYLNTMMDEDAVDREMKHAAERARGDANNKLVVGRQLMKKQIHFREFLHMAQRLSLVPHVEELVALSSVSPICHCISRRHIWPQYLIDSQRPCLVDSQRCRAHLDHRNRPTPAPAYLR